MAANLGVGLAWIVMISAGGGLLSYSGERSDQIGYTPFLQIVSGFGAALLGNAIGAMVVTLLIAPTNPQWHIPLAFTIIIGIIFAFAAAAYCRWRPIRE